MESLSSDRVKSISTSFPNLPKEYLQWLLSEGWGEHESGFMFYSGPVHAKEVLGGEVTRDIEVLLIADDMAGYCIGFDNNSELVGIDGGSLEIEYIKRSLRSYLES